MQNRFKFGGKELNSTEFFDGAGLEIYDFHARNYDPQIGRFHSIDPLTTQFYSWNPYTYSYNNPVRFGDPTGMAATDWVGKKNGDGSTTWKWDDKITSAEQAKDAKYDSYQAPGSTLENAKIGDGPVATVYFGKSKAEGIGYDESNFTNWSAVNGSKYDNPLQAYKAWQSDAGYHRGEGFGDRLSRIVGYFSYEARRDYASGGMNMYGGYGRMAEVAEELFTVNPNKFDYFFGRVVTGSEHNIARSAQNLKDLTTLGIDTEAKLMSVFDQAAKSGTIISTKTSQYGTTIMRNVNIGNKGSIGVGFFYEGGNTSVIPSISTIIPKLFQ